MLNTEAQSISAGKNEHKIAALKIQIPISVQKGIIFVIIKPYAACFIYSYFYAFIFLNFLLSCWFAPQKKNAMMISFACCGYHAANAKRTNEQMKKKEFQT